MSDMSFLYQYRGTLYPINTELSAHGCVDPRYSYEEVTSLVDLSCLKLVEDSSTTRQALKTVPNELCYNLMKAALYSSKDRSIEALVECWPWQSLVLRKFAPDLFEEIGALFNDFYLCDRMRRGVKYTTCLAHTFVECLKKRAPTKLRYLDLTGYPAAEVIANYLSSHVLLVYNEARQKDIIKLYNNATQNLPEDKRNQYSIEATLPEASYMVTLDAFIQTSEAHMELCRALKTSKLEQCRFKLRLSKLDMTNLGVPRISVLLDQIATEHLTGLCLQYNSLNQDGLMILSTALQTFENLVSLDLSCNAINLVTQQKSVDVLSATFSRLPSLCRLDLSNGRTKNKLSQILSHLPSSLHFLRLCACGISEGDLKYLQSSHHAQSIQELDISENSIRQHLFPLLGLLQSMANNLLFLEMESCDFEEEDFSEIFQICEDLVRLKYWNVSGYSLLIYSVLLTGIPSIINMSSLSYLKLTYPAQCYISNEMDEIYAEKSLFVRQITQQLNSACDNIGRTYIKLVFV